jgi:hypothetical protein
MQENPLVFRAQAHLMADLGGTLRQSRCSSRARSTASARLDTRSFA